MIIYYLNKSDEYPMMENSLYNIVAIRQKFVDSGYCFIVYYTDGTFTNIGKIKDITFKEILKEV